MIKDMESQIQATLEDRLSGIERLLSGITQSPGQANPGRAAPSLSALSAPLTEPTGLRSSNGATASQHATLSEEAPVDAGATGQLSDALRQLSLAMDPMAVTKSEGMVYRPEFHAQHKLKDVPVKTIDHQKMSLQELNYGMLCVLEHLLLSGSEAWSTYLQHMKFVLRQAVNKSYTDGAYVGYDRMVVDRFLQDKKHGFVAGDMLSVSSNFHAANFRKETIKTTRKTGRRAQRPSKSDGGWEEPVEIPTDWPDDICFYFNRRRCYGRCVRSHICKKCKGNHKDLDCKETKN